MRRLRRGPRSKGGALVTPAQTRAAILAAVESREPERLRIYAEMSEQEKPPREVEVNLRTKDGFPMKFGGSEPRSKTR